MLIVCDSNALTHMHLLYHRNNPTKHPSTPLNHYFHTGLAYGGAQRDEVKELLEPLIGNTDSNILECSMAALSLALVYVGTCNDDIGSVILQRLMESSDEELNNTASRFMCLGE